MKIGTWIDRLAGATFALAVARWLGPEALGEWTLMLLAAWTLSPWPNKSFETRIASATLGVGAVLIVSWLWPWAGERRTILLALTFGILGVRAAHALPGDRRWPVGVSLAGFSASFVVLGVTRSILAATITLAAVNLFLVLVHRIYHHEEFRKPERLPWAAFVSPWASALIQSQIIFWGYALGLPPRSMGELAAALFLLEFMKGALALVTARTAGSLEHFAAQRESFLEAVRGAAAYAFLIMPPLVLGIYFGAVWLVVNILGGAFAGSVGALQLLVWAFALSFLSLMGERVLKSKGRPTLDLRLGAACVEAVLYYAWIPAMGVDGACYARVVGEGAAFCAIAWRIHHAVPGIINPFRKQIG